MLHEERKKALINLLISSAREQKIHRTINNDLAEIKFLMGWGDNFSSDEILMIAVDSFKRDCREIARFLV